MSAAPHPRFASLRAEPSTDAPRDPSRLARIDKTRSEMLAQAQAIATTLAEEASNLAVLSRRLASRRIDEVVIAGCGDSWFAGLAARYAFRARLGVPAAGVQAHDWALYDADASNPGTLVFAISASGTTPAVIEAIERGKARGAFAVGVTNTAGSPLERACDATLMVHATRSGWPTQSTTACLALLIAAAEAIGGARGAPDAVLTSALAGLALGVEAISTLVAGPMAEVGQAWARASFAAFSGAGPSFAVASIGAAKIRELGPIHAVAWPLEELHHYRAQKPGDPLVLLAPDAASRARALDAAIVGAGVGGRTLAILGSGDAEIERLVECLLVLPPFHPLLAPILHLVPLHHLAHAFAVARARCDLGYPGAWPNGK